MPNKKYYFWRGGNENTEYKTGSECCFYDENFNFVTYVNCTDLGEYITSPDIATVKYMRRTCMHNFGRYGMVYLSESVSERPNTFIKYGHTVKLPALILDEDPTIKDINNRLNLIKNEVEIDVSTNLFNNEEWVGKTNIDLKTGEVIEGQYDEWGVTGFIEVMPNNEYTFTYVPQPNNEKVLGSEICFYTSDFKLVESNKVLNTDYHITIPNNDNIVYMRRVVKSEFVLYGMVTLGKEFAMKYESFKNSVRIPNLKLDNNINLISEDDVEYVISIDKYGELKPIPKAHLNLPSSFPKYEFTGESSRKEDFYITQHSDNNGLGYIFIMSYDGYVKRYKRLPAFAYNFRKYKNSKGEIRFTYYQVSNIEYPKVPMNGGYDNTKLIVMDKDFKILDEVTLLPHGSLAENHPCENHDYIYLDDGHYIVLAYHPKVVTNVPNKVGEYKAINCIIQEQKEGEVLLHWESTNEPKMYEYSHTNSDFTNFNNEQTVYNDYNHINSINIDPKTGDILCSWRHAGIGKISRTTGELLWFAGRKHIDIQGMTTEQVGYLQHHAKYNYDGSITIFDNSGCVTNNTRCCRYWIDENQLTLTKFQELKSPKAKSGYMGSMDLLHEDKDIYMIAYGAGWKNIAFHEYDFDNNKELCKLVFIDGHDMYRVWRDYTL